jgi:site-specific DNA recombinase
MTLALVYCRVSTEDQADRGVSLEVQEADCRAWCAREGLDVELFVDAGRSGRTLDRPGLQQLLGRLPDADALVVWRVDRLSRDMVDQGLIIRELRKRRVRFVAVQQPEVGTDSPEGDLVGNVLGAVGQFESALIGARVKAARDRLAASGRPLTAPPYGYAKADDGDGWAVVPAEAEIIHLVDGLYLGGLGVTRIAQELNGRGIPSPDGGIWWPSAVRHLLERTIYAGLLSWGASRKIRGQRTRRPEQAATVAPAKGVPPIRDTATWDRICRLRETRTPGDHAGPVRYPFTPVLFCGLCGAGMTGRTWRTRRGALTRTYLCHRAHIHHIHPPLTLREDELIDAVRQLIAAVLAGEVIPPTSEDVDRAETVTELTDLDRRRARLVAAYTAETLTLEELQDLTGKLNARRLVLEDRLAAHPKAEPIPAEEAAEMLAMPDSRDRLRAWVLRIIAEIHYDGTHADIRLQPFSASREPMRCDVRTIRLPRRTGGKQCH